MKHPSNKEQNNLLNAKKNEEIVYIPDSKDTWVIGNQRGYTLEQLSMLQLSEQESLEDATKFHSQVLAKAASYCILNGLKAVFFHWIFWRYLYYWKGYTNEQFEAIIKTAKKKVQAKSYLNSTIYLTGMRITTLQMTEEEQKQFQLEHTSE